MDGLIVFLFLFYTTFQLFLDLVVKTVKQHYITQEFDQKINLFLQLFFLFI